MNKKYSRYNTLLKVNDRFGLFYNAMSDRFIVLKTPAYEALLRNDVTDLEHNAPTLYGQLVEAGGIVDADVDEVQLVRDMIHRIDDDDTVFHLHVNPTVDCNFRCWYCYEDHVKDSKMSEKTRDAVEKLIDNIISQHKGLRKFCLSFFGGEPLMYFGQVARPLMEFLCEKCVSTKVTPQFQFTTNGYLLTDKMVDFFKGKNVGFQITLDGNRELHDRTRFTKNGDGSFDRIVRNIKLLASYGHAVIIRINFTADNLESISSVCEEFFDLTSEAKKCVRFDFQRVWQDVGKAESEDSVEELVLGYLRMCRENGFEAGYVKFHDKVRYSCYGDKRNYMLVNYDGNIFKCTARDFIADNCCGRICDDGHIELDNAKVECRESAKFSMAVCHVCRIAPICGGGCRQKAVENKDFGKCLYGYTDENINDLILDRFDYLFAAKDKVSELYNH